MEIIARLTVFILCLLPFGYGFYGAFAGTLGPDPAETLMHITGEWSARILLLTLLISPLRQLQSLRWIFKLRRMLGLYAFFYAVVHLVTFAHFYLGWSARVMLEELIERPYITLGFGALVLMLPLAVTSTRAMQRRLGKNWQRLHRLVYGASLLVCGHILWQVRSDAGEAIVYIVLFGLLLGWRARRFYRRRGRRQPNSNALGTC
ncbi:MAG: protein-methionine-sulfoxide reductase heme-binding subunit MsrQ [Halioglobus sp.]